MSNEIINKISIDYLLNKEQLAKYKKETDKSKKNYKEKRFYRKRIYDLTKQLLKYDSSGNITSDNITPYNITPDIKYDFNNYVNTCINFFKNLDNNDIIQDNLGNLDNFIEDEFRSSHHNISYEEANNELIKTLTVSDNTLDQFVIKKKLKKNDMILPRKKNINLKDPMLKTKGVKKIAKKKNIGNNYEETIEDKK